MPHHLLLATGFVEQLRSDTFVSPGWSLALVYGGLLGACLFWFLAEVMVALRFAARARQADASYQGEAPLLPGPAIVHGAVEYAAGEERAVRLEVDQDGEEEESSGSWTTRWTEVDRRVFTAPFYLRLASGKRVRVEPTEQVYLVDDMDGLIRINKARRRRVAELTEGEMTFAVGELREGPDPELGTGGYRDIPHAMVMQAPAGEDLYLSSRPLGQGFRKKARFDGISAVVILALSLLLQLCWYTYHQRLWLGHDVTADVVGLRHYTTKDSDGDTVHHYEVTSRAVQVEGDLVDEVSRANFGQLHRGMRVHWRVVPGSPGSSAIGKGASTSWVTGLVLFFLLIGVALFYYFRHKLRPWYEQKQVVEAHQGRLPDGFRKP